MVCYAPSTGTLAVIGVGIYILWHRTIGHFFGMFGTVMEIAVILGAEVGAAIFLVWLTRSIRRRRAQTGACTTCRFRCQQALAARPNVLVNRVDRRRPAAARPVLSCHPAAPVLPARVAASLRRVRPAVPISIGPDRSAATTASAAQPAPPVAGATRMPLRRGHGAPRFMGPVPSPFSVRGPVHGPASSLPPSATRVSSPIPAPEPEPEFVPEPELAPELEAVDVDGYVLTPEGVDTPDRTGPPGTASEPASPAVTLPH